MTMHRYETSTPRLAFGITAVAMSAITIGVLVVLPASMEADSHEPGLLLTSKTITLASNNAVTGATTDVVAADESELATTRCTPSKPNAEPED